MGEDFHAVAQFVEAFGHDVLAYCHTAFDYYVVSCFGPVSTKRRSTTLLSRTTYMYAPPRSISTALAYTLMASVRTSLSTRTRVNSPGSSTWSGLGISARTENVPVAGST